MAFPISKDIKSDMDELITQNLTFKQLYDKLQEKYIITVDEIMHTGGGTIPTWGCKVNVHEISISAPFQNRDIAAFAHEILHVWLDNHGFSENKIVLTWLQKLPFPIPFLFCDANLVAHINNSLAHRKMVSEYLKHGFALKDFIVDYEICPVNDNYMAEIDEKFYNQGHPNEAIGIFIGQFIACKHVLNPVYKTQVIECLNLLRLKNEELYDICDLFVAEWEDISPQFNLVHIITFAYSVRDWYNKNKLLFCESSFS